MNKITAITLLLILSNSHLQSQQDSSFNRTFFTFRQATSNLSTELSTEGITDFTRWHDSLMTDKMQSYIYEIRVQLSVINTYGIFETKMATYFENGTSYSRQDLTMEITQNECSFWYYINELKKSEDALSNIIKAVLLMKGWLANGFPSSKFCPFIFEPIEILFDKPQKQAVLKKAF